MSETTDDTEAALVAELSEAKSQPHSENGLSNGFTNGFTNEDATSDGQPKRKKLKQKGGKIPGETSEARRESHKIIEQKRRQKINDKINELRELLNYPDGSQNKAVVLQAAVDNIKNLKVVCSKLLSSHRQLQEEYLQTLAENEKLRKSNAEIGMQFQEPIDHKKDMKQGMNGFGNSSADLRLPDMSFLYEDGPTVTLQQRNHLTLPTFGRDSYSGLLNHNGLGYPQQEAVVNSNDNDSRQVLNRLLFGNDGNQ